MEEISPQALPRIQELAPYAPGLSMDEIRTRHGLGQVIKMASNENPLGASPLAVEAMRAAAPYAFRYPRGGNPELVEAIAGFHNVPQNRVVAGNGSDEIIDLLIRIMAEPGSHNVVCCEPCFSLYPIQARIAGVEIRRQPLRGDFSPDFDALLARADKNTRLVFLTTPDNPSGYCPPLCDISAFAENLARKCPRALLFVDEAYMDFTPEEKDFSLLANGRLPENVAFSRTFSKSLGLAGMRLGYAVMPQRLTDAFWRARLPFSINIMVEQGALAALKDDAFRQATLGTVARGRQTLHDGLSGLGCHVLPSAANFLMFSLPSGAMRPDECFESLLRRGIIIRQLKSYGLPDWLRVSVGNDSENTAFLKAMRSLLRPEDKNERQSAHNHH